MTTTNITLTTSFQISQDEQMNQWVPLQTLREMWEQNQVEMLRQKIDRVDIALRPYNQYVNGELVVPFEKVKGMCKQPLVQKVNRAMLSGETFCRKTGKVFLVKNNGKLYISREWFLDMVRYGLVKKTKLPIAQSNLVC